MTTTTAKLGPLNQTGSMWSEKASGPTYAIRDPGRDKVCTYDYDGETRSYVREGRRRFVLDDYSGAILMEDEAANAACGGYTFVVASADDAAAVNALYREDEAIMEARRAEAVRLSGGDDNRRIQAMMSMGYQDGEPALFERDGVTWAKFGRNASHSFYGGVGPDGSLWYASEEDGYDERRDPWRAERIESFRGHYWGHY